ncbi:hypothetical protein AVEN_175713-1 [Araneus ventricosus]|uniref:Uncharacterized protein n=1 Tax=Araneus ventricosus TaxID=182803 RepID=A0A4Y2G7X1_ARAVE|nr:hypothetical protein AVEN_175713-1 [Araneus ventricosus]
MPISEIKYEEGCEIISPCPVPHSPILSHRRVEKSHDAPMTLATPLDADQTMERRGCLCFNLECRCLLRSVAKGLGGKGHIDSPGLETKYKGVLVAFLSRI